MESFILNKRRGTTKNLEKKRDFHHLRKKYFHNCHKIVRIGNIMQHDVKVDFIQQELTQELGDPLNFAIRDILSTIVFEQHNLLIESIDCTRRRSIHSSTPFQDSIHIYKVAFQEIIQN